MRKFFLFALLFVCFSPLAMAQLICSNNGNLILYTNYDGGVLNINVDVNMPNIKIGIVTYEAVEVNLSGPYVNNVTAIQYAGYNSNNNNCGGPLIPTTVINGAPVGVTPVIVYSPASPLANANGNPNIICGYSCDTNVNQGGCNTVDQINAYFMGVFPGSTLRFHKIQYNCWTNSPQTLSGAGNCCLVPVGIPFLMTTVVTQPSCNGACDGSIMAVATGGTPPYAYQWAGGPPTATYANLCPGTYTVVATDAMNNTTLQTVTLLNPPPIATNLSVTACSFYAFNGVTYTSSGLYKDTMQSAAGCDSIINLNLTINTVNNAITQNGNQLAAVAGYTYKWLDCTSNTLVPGAVAQYFTPTVSGSYAVIASANGCTDTSICKNVVISATNDIQTLAPVSLYPNPASDLLYIDIDAAYIGKQCRVYDAVGRLVTTQTLQQTHNQLTLTALSRGMYVVCIEGLQQKWKLQK